MTNDVLYTLTAKSSTFLMLDTQPGGKYAPKEGYALSGVLPLGPNYVSLVYKRQEECDQIAKAIEAIDNQIKEVE